MFDKIIDLLDDCRVWQVCEYCKIRRFARQRKYGKYIFTRDAYVCRHCYKHTLERHIGAR